MLTIQLVIELMEIAVGTRTAIARVVQQRLHITAYVVDKVSADLCPSHNRCVARQNNNT